MDVLSTELGDSDDVFQGIAKKHFQPASNVDSCSNGECKARFTFYKKGRNCFRCGKVFCSTCLRRKCYLSSLAEPDPSGKLYPVCGACSFQPQQVGKIRCRKRELMAYRRLRCERNKLGGPPMLDDMNFENECNRLIQGFKSNVKKSEIVMFGIDIISSFHTLHWQRSNFKNKKRHTPKCNLCNGAFTQASRKSNCSICGLVLCHSCCSSDLVIYFSDEDKDCEDVEPKLAIIRIVGCPSVEPKLSMYVLVCVRCRERLEVQQVKDYYGEVEAEEERRSVTEEVIAGYKKMRRTRVKIQGQIEQYHDLTLALESGEKGNSSRTNIHVLAKAQLDLADHFSALSNLVLGLKKLSPHSTVLRTVLTNMMRANARFYQENKHIYIEVKARLEDITPPHVLNAIQTCIDEKAISSTYLSVRQLGLESLFISDRYQLSHAVALTLAMAEQVAESDVKEMLSCSSEDDWEAYVSRSKLFLSDQLKNHRFVRLSRQLPCLPASQRSQRAAGTLLERGAEVLGQLIRQFEERCSERSYSLTKAALHTALQEIEVLAPQTIST